MPDCFDYAPFLRKATVYLLERATRLTEKKADEIMKKSGMDLEPRHMWVLVLADNNKLSQKEIATCLSINSNTMVKLTDFLESKNLVKRVRNIENRKEHIVTLTSKGLDTVHKWKGLVEKYGGEVAVPLTPSECAVLNKLLVKIITSTKI
jgi:DNA-binding MarR family transcriptional regulator